MKKILITGASGGLGQALYRHFSQRYAVTGLCFTHALPELQPLDLLEAPAVMALFQRLQPEIVIHTVGLTDVDRCERDLALAVDLNLRSTLHVRLAAEAVGAKLIHLSTNDVFDGRQGHYTETMQPQPLNAYALTKYMAEQILANLPKCLILRCHLFAWYSSGKVSFARWLAEQLGRGERVTLFEDQFNSPIYVSTIAQQIEVLLEAEGVYHLGSERLSRYASGKLMAEGLGLEPDLIQPGSLAGKGFLAPRPRDVSLNVDKLWRDWGLRTTMASEVQAFVRDRPNFKV